MSKSFPSARSKTLGLLIWGVLVITFGLVLYQAYVEAELFQWIVLIAIIIITFLLVGTIWFGTRYSIANDHLLVKIGPIIHSNISISKITEISRTNNPLASPANSLNRLALKSGNQTLILISPKDEADFIKAIKQVNSRILVVI